MASYLLVPKQRLLQHYRHTVQVNFESHPFYRRHRSFVSPHHYPHGMHICARVTCVPVLQEMRSSDSAAIGHRVMRYPCPGLLRPSTPISPVSDKKHCDTTQYLHVSNSSQTKTLLPSGYGVIFLGSAQPSQTA
uniref:Uncharacterized protein n=1 Tax=Steinernema glaseri TaxID=37863 RepID=A0A1I8AB69_9BILA